MPVKLLEAALWVGLVLTAAACQPEAGSDTREPSGNGERASVDLIVMNARVLTMDEDFSIQDTVVVDAGKILAVGDESLVATYSADHLVNLQGATLMPGFIDSHTHIRGRAQRFIELGEVNSIVRMQELIRAKVAEIGEGEWITGYGWSEDELSEGRKPLRQDLDAAAPANPVTLTRAGGHSAVVSTLALEAAGITNATPDPEGGVIERDVAGVATGIIRERQGIVGRLVPDTTDAERLSSLRANLNGLLSKGITSITDASNSPQNFSLWETLYAEGDVALPRAAVQFQWHDPEAIAELKRRVGDGTDFLRIGPIKIFADGGFTGPAAFTKAPYLDQDDYRGYLRLIEPELASLIKEIHEAGWQMGIHAIGDAAIELVVAQLANTLERNPREDHRHYLNHFSMRPADTTMATMASFGIHISQQPNFTYTLEGRYVANLDGWRLEHNNPLRSPMDHGIHVAISSDILPIGPMVGIYAAVTRKGRSGRVFAAQEAISIEEALRGYTINGAYLGFREHELGSLEPGKLADMVVLSDDILGVDPERILDIRIEQTYLGGKLVYERGAQPE